MSKRNDAFENYVYSLSDNDFRLLKNAIDKRIDKDLYGFTTYEKLPNIMVEILYVQNVTP